MAFTSPEENIGRLRLVEGNTVVDFGSGSGTYAIAAGKRIGTSGKVYAVDLQKDLLGNIVEAARQKGLSNIETLWGDIETKGGSGLADGLTDAVIISNTLFQAEDKEGLIAEAFRILKDGGRVLLVDWKDSFGNLGPTQEHVVTEDTARALFLQAGFRLETIFPAGDHHYGFIFVKP